MRKILSVLLFALLAVNTFCFATPKLVKEIVNDDYDVHFKILQEDDDVYVSVTDETKYDMEIRVLTYSVPDALDAVMELDSKLTYPTTSVKKLIDELRGEGDWVTNSENGDYYFEINSRDEYSVHYDSREVKKNKQITLNVLDYQDTTSPNSFDDNKYIWEAFEAAHPNIKIERESLFNEPFHRKTEAYAASGRMADVFFLWPAGRSSVVHDKKLAKDLTPFLKKDGIYDDYNQACLDPSKQLSGYVAEIPFGLTVTNCTFANTKVLKELGLKPAKTYEELKAQLPILKKAGKELIIMANQDDWVMQSCLFSLVLGRMAGSNWAQDIMDGKAKFTDVPFKSAVQMIKTMYDDGVLSKKSLSTGYGDVTTMFAAEEGAYFIDGDWRTGAFLTDWSTGEALIPPSKQASDIELIPFPALPGEILPGSNSGTLGAGYGMDSYIDKGSEKEAAAWELIKWLSGPEMQQRRLDTGASFPSLKKGIDYSNLEPLLAKRADYYLETKELTPVFDSVFSYYVSSVINAKLQELGLGKCSVDDVCEAVQYAYDTDW